MRRLTCWVAMIVLAASMACDGGSSSEGEAAAGVEVRCTDEGIVVDGTSVTASADGVHLEVNNTTGKDARLVASRVQENPTMTVPPGTSTIVALIPPGEVRLWCGPDNENPRNRSAAVTVEDPGGFYRSVDLPATLGCQPDSTVDGHDPGRGATAREAADAFGRILEEGGQGKVRITEGNGYRDHDRQEFLLFVDEQGWGTIDAYRDSHPEHTDEPYRAYYGEVCTDRVFPGLRSGSTGSSG